MTRVPARRAHAAAGAHDGEVASSRARSVSCLGWRAAGWLVVRGTGSRPGCGRCCRHSSAGRRLRWLATRSGELPLSSSAWPWSSSATASLHRLPALHDPHRPGSTRPPTTPSAPASWRWHDAPGCGAVAPGADRLPALLRLGDPGTVPSFLVALDPLDREFGGRRRLSGSASWRWPSRVARGGAADNHGDRGESRDLRMESPCPEAFPPPARALPARPRRSPASAVTSTDVDPDYGAALSTQATRPAW